MSKSPAQNLYSVGEAADYLGVSISTLRRWDSLGTFSPIRTPGGQRRYTKSQLEFFLTGGKLEVSTTADAVGSAKLDEEVRDEKSHISPQSEAIPAPHFQPPTSKPEIGFSDISRWAFKSTGASLNSAAQEGEEYLKNIAHGLIFILNRLVRAVTLTYSVLLALVLAGTRTLVRGSVFATLTPLKMVLAVTRQLLVAGWQVLHTGFAILSFTTVSAFRFLLHLFLHLEGGIRKHLQGGIVALRSFGLIVLRLLLAFYAGSQKALDRADKALIKASQNLLISAHQAALLTVRLTLHLEGEIRKHLQGVLAALRTLTHATAQAGAIALGAKVGKHHQIVRSQISDIRSQIAKTFYKSADVLANFSSRTSNAITSNVITIPSRLLPLAVAVFILSSLGIVASEVMPGVSLPRPSFKLPELSLNLPFFSTSKESKPTFEVSGPDTSDVGFDSSRVEARLDELSAVIAAFSLHKHAFEKITLTSTYFSSLDASKLTGITGVDANLLDSLDSGDFLRSNKVDTAEAAITFRATPGSTDVSGGPLYINPGSASANYTLFGVALNGSSKFRVDAEGDVSLDGSLSVGGNITADSNATYDIGTSGTRFRDAYFSGTVTVGSGTTTIDTSGITTGTLTASSLTGTGQVTLTRAPTSAHTGTWAIDSATWNAADASVYVNASSAGSDTNLFALAVGGNVKFAIDAEGDVFGNNLVVAGSTTQATTTVSGDLTIEGNTTIGDATTDTLTANPATLTWAGGNKTIDITGAATRTLTLLNSTASQVADLDLSDGSLKLGGTERISNAGAGALTTLSLGGAVSGATTITGSGNINTTGGALQTNSVTRIDNAGAGTLASLTLTTDLAVADGGTGASTLTDGGVLLGAGTAAITSTGVLAKGSIIVGDGVTAPVALAVGTNDQVLTADSAQASGLKWAAGGGEEANQIVGFASACPTGWTEYTAARGRSVVGTPASGTNAATVGTALTDSGTRTITAVPAHTHAAGTLAADSAGAHTHPITVYDGGASAVAQVGAQVGPSTSTANTQSAGAHTHTVSGSTASTGDASVDVTMPYIQLTYCSKDAGADYAEWALAPEHYEPGTLVSVDPSVPEGIIMSHHEYDPTMVGVVSGAPGWTIGIESPESVQLALNGRVPVKVDPNSEPIAPGDFITSSENPGWAKKATRMGRTIGIAMEEWEPGTTKQHVVIFLNLGYYLGGLADDGNLLTIDRDVLVKGDIEAEEGIFEKLLVKIEATFKKVVAEVLEVKEVFAQRLSVQGEARFGSGIILASQGEKPVCDSSQRGKIWYTKKEPTDLVEVCIKNSGTYLWQPIY